MKSVTTKGDMPKEPHFAVISYDTITEHDYYDEGGVGNRVSIVKYTAFSSEDELKTWLQRQHADVHKFTIVTVRPLDVQVEVKVGFK